jgi:trans-aconitate 2-methyltransferase
MSWDPKKYLSYADERTRPAADLLARVTNDAPMRVADLGCGPGNSTALLAARWPRSHIDAVDSSDAMLRQARLSGLPAHWILADLANWVPDTAYDVVFSNATYQWLPDHRSLLPRLFGFVRPGGTFAFQVPCNFDAPSHVLMREVAEAGPWAAKLRNVREASVLPADAYYDILSPLARALDIWETTYLQVMDGDDPVFDWVSATGLRPFVQALDEAEREAFTQAYRLRLHHAYPKRADGKTLFPFQRLFVVAGT